jgi:SpoVK/Ycf46/Vps4 family AAA+-type ATPase
METRVFDNTIALPSASIKASTAQLIGFEKKYQRIYSNLRLLLDPEGLAKWSQKFHNTQLPIISQLDERYPLIILAGDVGTGKTISALGFADRMTRELNKEGFFLKLNTRVRGQGLHGEMGSLVNDAFAELKNQTGKKRLGFMLIDEADAIATTRSTMQMHQEEKAAVNTLIQKIDEVRELGGRAIIFMATNRLHFIDEAIIRRAAAILEFKRPDHNERIELFSKSLEGIALSKQELEELAKLTGEHGESVGHSFSDIRLKILPEAIAKCFPKSALTFELLRETVKEIKPSPEIK